MAADRIARRARAPLAAIIVLLHGFDAAAQHNVWVVEPPSEYAPGAQFTFAVSTSGEISGYTETTIKLHDDLRLISVAVQDESHPLLVGCALDATGYDCDQDCDGPAGCPLGTISVTATAGPVAGGFERTVVLTSADSLAFDGLTFRFTAEITPFGPCDPAEVSFNGTPPSPTRTIPDFALLSPACAPPFDTVIADPPVTAGRANPPLAFRLMAGSYALHVPEAETRAFSAALGNALQCKPPGSDSFGPCDAAAFRDFVVLDALQSFPLLLRATAVDLPSPPAGDAVIRIDRAAIRGLPSTGEFDEIPVQVESQATDLVLDVGDGAYDPGETVLLVVQAAMNSAAGHEPPSATWEIRTPTCTRCAPLSLPYLNSWLTQASGSNPATLTVPSGEQLAAHGIPADAVVEMQLWATHSCSTGCGDYSESVDVWINGAAPQNDSCRIRGSDTVGVLGQAELVLERVPAGGAAVPVTEDVTWSLARDSIGSLVATTSGRAMYTAPETPGSAAVQASAPECTGGVPPFTVSVAKLLRLTLSADHRKVMPGGLVRLTGVVESLSSTPVTGLRFRVRIDPLLKPLRRMPATSGIVSRPLAEPIFKGVLRGAAQSAAAAGLELEADLPAQSSGELSWPLLARAVGSGGKAQATIEVYNPAGTSTEPPQPIDTAHLIIEIGEDPELSEATLFGKVFDDRDGDGEQDEDEPGIPGAMVALSSSVYATTDAQGKYHIARLDPGRQAVKLNVASLPLGAEVTTDVRREVTLSPGLFAKVSFGVKLASLADRRPLALVPAQSGVRILERRPVYRARLENAAGERLVAQNGKQKVAGRLEEGSWILDLPLDAGDPHWLLVEQAADGRTWLTSLTLRVYTRATDGTLVLPQGPQPLAELVLAPPDAAVSGSELRFTGQAQAALALTVSGAELGCNVKAEPKEGAVPLRCDIKVTEDLASLTLAVDPAADALGDDPPLTEVTLPAKVDASTHFLVGLAGVEGSALLPREEGKLLAWNAGGSFFYRGALEGGWLLTAGADAWARDLLLQEDGSWRRAGGIGAALLAHDPRRVFRDLDPESTYPTYGDRSQTVDERESGGRFFLRLQKGESYLKWGGINTAIDDAEIGRYVRSLYGAGGVLRLGDEAGWRLRATAFAAQPDTLAARDELVVTGGSLYFLDHRELVEGSLRVTLELLDEISGLPVRATPLVEGADYEADYAGGRIVLDPTLPYRSFGTSLTAVSGGGQTARLIVEYEYLPGAEPTDWSAGARVVTGYGPLSIGVTGVTELIGLSNGGELNSRYELLGATARLDLGAPLRVRVEAAHSEGGSHVAARSLDGGLSFGDRTAGDTGSGEAAAIELSTALAGFQAGAYGRLIEAGFRDSRTSPGQRLVQGGLRLQGDFSSGTRLWGNFDHRQSRLIPSAYGAEAASGPLVQRELALVGVAQQLGSFNAAVEGRYEALPRTEQSLALAGAKLSYRLTPSFTLSLRRRQLLLADPSMRAASPTGETAAGLLFEAHGVKLATEVGADDEAHLFGRALGSVPVDDGTELYAGYDVGSRLAGSLDPNEARDRNNLVVGGRRSLEDGTLVYSEQSLRVDGSERVLTRTVGGQVPLSRRLTVGLTYERGDVELAPGATTGLLRDSASAAASLMGEVVTLRLGVDGRYDRRNGERAAELGGHARLEVRAGESVTIALAGRGGTAFAAAGGADSAQGRQAWEGGAGFAFRPVHSDRLNLFGRYAIVHERERPEGQAGYLTQISHVVAAALVYDVWGPFALSPKLAYRNTQAREAEGAATDQALLAALRGDVHVSGSWDVGLEGRACMAPQSELEPRFGALAEVSLLALQWLRLGAGYNFSSISAAGVRCVEPGARGLYLRAEALY